MNKTLHPFDQRTYDGKWHPVFIKVEIRADGELSLTGTVGPMRNGNAYGGSGQIDMEYAHRNPADNDNRYDNPITTKELHFAKEWNAKKWLDLLDIWSKWHLNHLQSGCQHQRAARWEDKRINLDELPKHTSVNSDKLGAMAIWVRKDEHPDGLLCEPCPECGYKYGSAWLKEELPQIVIEFLENLPETDITPAWC